MLKKTIQIKTYQPYNLIREAKTRCYPPKEAFIITESLAEIYLQELLDHTAFRIIKCQWSVVDGFSTENITSMTLITKWGFDRSTGHSEYKLKYNEDFSDSQVLLMSLVPIQLFVSISHSHKLYGKILSHIVQGIFDQYDFSLKKKQKK
jgi:hypothetical protein|uniref:Uncharacterized protein n=1 Tax=Sipha flava TaxID=143950 RepID=A0A2S2QXB4_9HEMI